MPKVVCNGQPKTALCDQDSAAMAGIETQEGYATHGIAMVNAMRDAGWDMGHCVERSHTLCGFAVRPVEAQSSERDDYTIYLPAGYSPSEGAASKLAGVHSLIRAAHLLDDCRHPNLWLSFASGRVSHESVNSVPYLIGPRLEADRLSHWITQTKQVAFPVCLWVLRQVSQALVEIHSAGWVHGLISAESVFVSQDGHVVLGNPWNATPIGQPYLSSDLKIATTQDDLINVAHLLKLTVQNCCSNASPRVESLTDAIANREIEAAEHLVDCLLALEVAAFGQSIQPRSAA